MALPAKQFVGPQILCTLASADDGKAAWLHTAGALRLLERLTLLRSELDAEPGPLDGASASPDGLSLRVRKQVRSRVQVSGSRGIRTENAPEKS